VTELAVILRVGEMTQAVSGDQLAGVSQVLYTILFASHRRQPTNDIHMNSPNSYFGLRIFILSLVLAMPSTGCDSRKHGDSGTSNYETNRIPGEAALPQQFAFVQTNLDSITLEDITNRIGPYSRSGHLSPDSPEVTYEFDFPDHSALLISLERPRPLQAKNKVHRARFMMNTNDLHLLP
jgi:hypothetical protein